MKKELVISIVSGMVILALGHVFNPTPLIQPSFQTSISSDDGKNMFVQIQNTGLQQAKNVIVGMDTNTSFAIDLFDCIESDSYTINTPTGYNDTNVNFEFDKLSTNLPCRLGIVFDSNPEFFRITLTGDDVRGYVWLYENNKVNLLFETNYYYYYLALSVGAFIYVFLLYYKKKYREH